MPLGIWAGPIEELVNADGVHNRQLSLGCRGRWHGWGMDRLGVCRFWRALRSRERLVPVWIGGAAVGLSIALAFLLRYVRGTGWGSSLLLGMLSGASAAAAVVALVMEPFEEVEGGAKAVTIPDVTPRRLRLDLGRSPVRENLFAAVFRKRFVAIFLGHGILYPSPSIR
jgi:hypothetical protein